MSESITSHRLNGLNGLNEALAVRVLDGPGRGNVCHRYQIEPTEKANETEPSKAARLVGATCRIRFQAGPILEVGVNGISNEALLAVVEHRLRGFQSGDYACWENTLALMKLQEAMACLHRRTRDRVAMGVEGTDEIIAAGF